MPSVESTKNCVALASKLEFLQSFGVLALLALLASVGSSSLVQLKLRLWVSAHLKLEKNTVLTAGTASRCGTRLSSIRVVPHRTRSSTLD